jgi:hypothetical protein
MIINMGLPRAEPAMKMSICAHELLSKRHVDHDKEERDLVISIIALSIQRR